MIQQETVCTLCCHPQKSLNDIQSEISNILSILGIQNGVCANPFDDTHYTFCVNRSGTSFDYRCFSEEKNFDDSLVDYW